MTEFQGEIDAISHGRRFEILLKMTQRKNNKTSHGVPSMGESHEKGKESHERRRNRCLRMRGKRSHRRAGKVGIKVEPHKQSNKEGYCLKKMLPRARSQRKYDVRVCVVYVGRTILEYPDKKEETDQAILQLRGNKWVSLWP